MTPATQLTIDLGGITQKAQILAALGAALCLGGPDGNHPVRPGEDRGWGMNWDALFDCLLNLHSGGIWGTAPRLAFPVKLTFAHAQPLARANPQAFAILRDILEQTRAAYARQNRQFDFELVALA
ncbi:MAG: barstar family protein [Comamonas sp.]|uniref:barstar family protein n=1 Tax=Comamonas sp. TaxID=34028 RepID=UPI002FC695DE